MGYTIITHFDSNGYYKLHSILSIIADETVCRVPYGRVDDKYRYQVDTLPYHLTVSSSKLPLFRLLSVLNGFAFKPFDITINGLDIMPGKNHSQVLYFSIAPSAEMDLLQTRMYQVIGNDKYLPGNHTNHITICISKDSGKIQRIKSLLSKGFTTFTLTVMSIGLYEIWPGKLLSEFHFAEQSELL